MGGTIIKSNPQFRLEGGWYEDQTFSEDTDAFNAHQTKITDYRFKQAPSFYQDFLVEYYENEWYSWLVDQLVMALFSGYKFDGPGAEEVERFFNKTCPDAKDQVVIMGLNVVREGTGALRKIRNGNGELRQIRYINGRAIRLREGSLREVENWSGGKKGPPFQVKYDQQYGESLGVTSNPDHDDTNTEARPGLDEMVVTRMTIAGVKNWYADFTEWPRLSPKDYLHDEVALCRIRRDPWSPYGIMFGRSCFHVIKSMRSLNRDLIASIKRLAATLLIFKANLDTVEGQAGKQAALETLASAFEDLDAATTGIVAIDERNSVGFPEGTRTERLIPIMEQLEPVMSALLLNFLVALGIVEQTGANKSLIAKQEIRARKQLREYQAAVARFFQIQVFPEITDKECQMVFDTELDPEYWVQFWSTGAVSRERVQDEFSIVDKGTTYVPLGGKAPSEGSSGSNDDTTSPGRKGGQGDTSVQKGAK